MSYATVPATVYYLVVRQGTEIVNRDASLSSFGGSLNDQEQLDQLMPWWRSLQTSQQTSIIDLVAVFGVSGLAGIDGFSRYMSTGLWQLAADAIMTTSWYAEQQSTTLTQPGGPYVFGPVKRTVNPLAPPILALLFPITQQGNLILEDGTHFVLELGGNIVFNG